MSTNIENGTRSRRNRTVKTLNEDYIYKAHYEEYYKEAKNENGADDEQIAEEK